MSKEETIEELKRRGLIGMERAEEPKKKRSLVKPDRLDLFGIQKARQFGKTFEWEMEFLFTLKFAGLLQSLGKVHFEEGDFIKEIEDSPCFSVSECVKCDERSQFREMRKEIARGFEEREARGLIRQSTKSRVDRILAKFNSKNRRT